MYTVGVGCFAGDRGVAAMTDVTYTTGVGLNRRKGASRIFHVPVGSRLTARCDVEGGQLGQSQSRPPPSIKLHPTLHHLLSTLLLTLLASSPSWLTRELQSAHSGDHPHPRSCQNSRSLPLSSLPSSAFCPSAVRFKLKMTRPSTALSSVSI